MTENSKNNIKRAKAERIRRVEAVLQEGAKIRLEIRHESPRYFD